MSNKKQKIDLLINNIDVSKPYSVTRFINSIKEVSHSEEYESSIIDENEEAQATLTHSSITNQNQKEICFHIYSEYIEKYLQKSVGELNIYEIEKQEKKVLLLIYVIHKLEFDLKEKNIIDLLKGINHRNSKEYFLALTTQINYSSEKDELFKSLMNFFRNNNNIKIILNDPQNSEDFVNIINYLISKEPKTFVNESLIKFIIEKLNQHDVHIFKILVTIFEHYNDDGTELKDVLSKFKEIKKKRRDFLNVNEEFYASFIIFLHKNSIPLREMFDDEHLDNLFTSFEKEKKEISQPDSPRFRRIVKAAVCMCNYYYQQTNNLDKSKEGISKILEKAFPFKDKRQANVNVQESFGDSKTYLYSTWNNVDEQNLNESEQHSSDNNLNQNNNDSSHFFSSILKSKSGLFDSLFEDFYPYKENSDDIYDYVKSNLNEELKKYILDYETIESILENVKDETKLINFLKLWSLWVLPAEECVLPGNKEGKLFDSLKPKIQELYKSHQEVVEKLLIFKAKPIELKLDHYSYLDLLYLQKIPLQEENLENPFKLIQNNFNYILNDFEQLKSSEKDKINKKLIISFCSLRIEHSNPQSLDNAIKFFHDKYRENNSGTNLFIRTTISNYIQNWLLKEKNKCNSNLCEFVWEFLPPTARNLKYFPESLKVTIREKKPINFYLYLLKSFMEDREKEKYLNCLIQSGELLIGKESLAHYERQINQFFKQVKQSHSEFHISDEISKYLQQLN